MTKEKTGQKRRSRPIRGLRWVAVRALVVLVVALVAAGCLASCGSESAPPQLVPAGDDEAEQNGAQPSNDAEALRQIITFPGDPEVTWTQITLGVGDEGDERVPGPNDHLTTAVLDYGDPAVVSALFGGGIEPNPGSIPARPWYPEAVDQAARDGTVALDLFTGDKDFGQANLVGVVTGDRSYVIVTSATT